MIAVGFTNLAAGLLADLLTWLVPQRWLV